jgi:hypothetical protein
MRANSVALRNPRPNFFSALAHPEDIIAKPQTAIKLRANRMIMVK